MSAAPARPTKIDCGEGAVAFLVESHELPLVDLGLSFRSGSALEPVAKLGLTRLFARMLRRGAKGWSSEKIEEMIDRYGAEISIEAAPSSINVHLQVIRRNLEPALRLLSDMLTRPTFPQDELSRLQRESVAEIIESRDHDASLARKFFRKLVFGDHAYGRGSSGTLTTIPSIERDDVVAAHATHVRRGNVVAGIAGDVTEGDVRKLIVPMIQTISSGASPTDATPDPNFPSGRRLLFVDKPARTQTQVLIGGAGTHARDPDHVALHVANTVFGGTFTARLMREVRSKRGWSYGAYSRLPIDRRREAFSMWTFPAAADAAACISLELTLLEKLLAEGISKDEIAFAHNYLVESYAFDIDTPYKRVRQAVDEELLDLPDDYHTGYLDHVRAVTRDQANAALSRRISASDLSVVVVGTADDLRGPVAGAIENLSSTTVVAYDSD